MFFTFLKKLFFVFFLAITSGNIFAQERVSRLLEMTQQDFGQAVKNYVQTFQIEYGQLFWSYNIEGVRVYLPNIADDKISLQNNYARWLFSTLSYSYNFSKKTLSKSYMIFKEVELMSNDFSLMTSGFDSANEEQHNQSIQYCLLWLAEHDQFKAILNDPVVIAGKPLIIVCKAEKEGDLIAAREINMILSVVGSFMLSDIEQKNLHIKEPFKSKIYVFVCNHKTEVCFAAVVLIRLLFYLKYKK